MQNERNDHICFFFCLLWILSVLTLLSYLVYLCPMISNGFVMCLIFAAKLTHVSIFLRQLKRAAVSCNDMLQFYVGVIRPVLEYAVAAWHTSLSWEMSDQLELLHKRAFCIIYGGSHFNSDSYASYCGELGIESWDVTCKTRPDSKAFFFIGSSSQPAACI